MNQNGFHDIFGSKNSGNASKPIVQKIIKPAPPEEDSDEEAELEVEKLQYKVIILGDGAVGKTSITHRFTNDEFQQSYLSTIGVDWFIKTITLTDSIEVTLQIWDIGGQQIGSKLLGNYIFGSDAVIFVYDITAPDTFSSLDLWMKMVEKATNQKKPILSIIANKTDIAHLRAITRAQHSEWAGRYKIGRNLSFEVSAKSGEGVNFAFSHIAAALAQINLEIDKDETNGEDANLLEQIIDQQHERTDKVLQAVVVDHSKYDEVFDSNTENDMKKNVEEEIMKDTEKKSPRKYSKKQKKKKKEKNATIKSNVCAIQ